MSMHFDILVTWEVLFVEVLGVQKFQRFTSIVVLNGREIGVNKLIFLQSFYFQAERMNSGSFGQISAVHEKGRA